MATSEQLQQWGRQGGRPKNPQWPNWIDLTALAAALQQPPKDRWQHDARCKGQTDLFFPTGHSGGSIVQANKARNICAQCPARWPCLTEAIRHTGQDNHGIYAGTVRTERAAIRRTLREQARRG